MLQHASRSNSTVPGARVTETHISRLFFSDDRVFKQLKPVVTGFLDHRSVDARCDAAAREFELNARIAPDVYLGTADVIEFGELADRMVVMRRLPDDRSVTNLLARSAFTEDHVRDIARTVATFHAGLPPEKPTGPAVDAHRMRWDDNTNELAPHVGPIIDESDHRRVTTLYTTWLEAHAELLDDRVDDGYVRDGHGDLLADDIFMLDDGPAILDCLAFRDDLRFVDVLDDVAFLAMDLHRLAGAAWAQRLLTDYAEFSGEHHPPALAHYYVAYRAHVRCKIACLRVEGGDDTFVAVAQRYHSLCLDQLERARLRLVLVGGGPGSGKTTLARALGEQFGCAVLSSDEIRKDLAGVERTVHELARPDEGIYAPESTEATYVEMLREADLLLRSGETVILDASWTSAEHRALASELAATRHAELIALECQIPDAVAKERIARRYADPFSTSDATPEIVDHLAKRRAPWPEAIVIDGTKEFSDVQAEALRCIRAFGRTNTSRTHPFTNDTTFWGAALGHI